MPTQPHPPNPPKAALEETTATASASANMARTPPPHAGGASGGKAASLASLALSGSSASLATPPAAPSSAGGMIHSAVKTPPPGSSGSAARTPNNASAAAHPGQQQRATPYSNTHTPIASAKRPRASLGGQRSASLARITPARERMRISSRQSMSARDLGAGTGTGTGGSGASRTLASGTLGQGEAVTANLSDESQGSEMSLKENAVALPSEPTARATTPVNMPAAAGRTTPVAAYALGGDDTMVPPPTPGLPMSPMHPARPMRSHDDHGHQEELARAAAAARQAAEAEAVAAALQAETDDDGGGGWKINNLFSPVLSFLGGANEEEAGMAAGVEGELDADREAAAAAMMAARNLASDSALTDDTAVGDEAEESGYATADEEEKQEQNGAAPYDHDVQMEDAHDQAADAAAADLAAAHLASPIAFRRRPEEEVEEAQQQTNSGYEVAYDATDASYSTLARPSEGEDSHNYSAEESHHADVEEDEEEEFNPYLFIKSLPRYNLVVPYPHHKICLPPKDPSDPPISLVLDLDETLVHCTVEPISDADMVFPVVFNGVEYSVNVRKRPYLEEFLQKVAGKFEVIVFTASQSVYANELLDRIDPEKRYIKHRMFRESCLQVEGNFLKDLNVLGRDLKKAVLVDNSPHAFGYQVENGIPIESWFSNEDNPNDTELLKLERFLRTLHGTTDVRHAVRQEFQTFRLVEDA